MQCRFVASNEDDLYEFSLIKLGKDANGVFIAISGW